MQNEDHFPVLAERIEIADPRRILESVTSELEALRTAVPTEQQGDLLTLHGALLVYELGGRAELIPSIVLPTSGRRLLEARVALAARRVAGRARGYDAARAAMAHAAEVIEGLVHVIDPELRVIAAA